MSIQESEVKYVIFDTESVPNARLINQLKYANEGLDDDAAVHRYQEELMAEHGNDFVNVGLQMGICVAVAKVDKDFRLLSIRGECSQSEWDIASKFWSLINKTRWPNQDELRFYNSLSEQERAKRLASECPYRGASVVTYNGRGFDFPLMEQAAFRWAISCPHYWNEQYGLRYRFGQKHIDILEMFNNFGACRIQGGMDAACKSILIPGKCGVSGGDVYNLWKSGEYKAVADYCIRDTLDTYLVFLRTRVMVGQLNHSQETSLRKDLMDKLTEMGAKQQVYLDYLDDWKACCK